jgi:hypothetical protein
MQWQMLLPIYWPVDWSLFQLKLFMDWVQMRAMQMQLREFMQPKVGPQITH